MVVLLIIVGALAFTLGLALGRVAPPPQADILLSDKRHGLLEDEIASAWEDKWGDSADIELYAPDDEEIEYNEEYPA